MCGTASRMIFAKSKILRSSRGWSTHGAAHRANVQCAKVNQFYFAFAYISCCFFLSQFAFYLLCFALLNFYFAFISSPEPKAQGELIVWDSSRRPSVCPHFQT